MASVSDRALCALAILKVNADQFGQDYIGHYVPFVVECIRGSPHDQVALPDLHASLKREFGIAIPSGALNTILRRAARQGYLEREHGVYRRAAAVTQAPSLRKLRDEVLSSQRVLIAELLVFALRLNVIWTEGEAQDALLGFIERNSLPVLALARVGTPIVQPEDRPDVADYVVSRFIATVAEQHPDRFERIEVLVRGSMLASVLYLPDLNAASKTLSGLDVYFDTRFLLRALGVVGDVPQSSARASLDLLFELGGNGRCFEDTIDEVRGVLSAARSFLERGTTSGRFVGETMLFVASAGWTPSDIDLLLSTLGRRLNALRIKPTARPVHIPSLTIDEVKLEQLLRKAVPSYKDDALHHDLDAITAIHRLRKGQSPYALESARAVFVTTNRPLAAVSAQFFMEEYGVVDHSGVPHCLLDSIFDSLLWIKRPSREPDLPRTRVLADAYAALTPSDSLWEKYLVEIERLRLQDDITTDDVYALRYALDSRRALTDVTLGQPEAFTEGTIRDVLERAKQSIAAEERAERDAVEAELRRLQMRQTAQSERARFLARRTAAYITRGVWILSLLVLAAVIYFATPGDLTSGAVAAPIALFALFVYLILSFLNLSIGWNLQPAIRTLEGWLGRRLEALLLRVLMATDASTQNGSGETVPGDA